MELTNPHTMPTPTSKQAGERTRKENWLGCYNTDATLWNNYGRSASASSPTRAVSVTINKYGVVGNGMRVMAVFPSLRSAVNTLAGAGFKITRQLGCGHVKTNFNARFTA